MSEIVNDLLKLQPGEPAGENVFPHRCAQTSPYPGE